VHLKIPAPGRYAKFLTATVGQALVYLYTYGWAWHIKEAAIMAAVALGVYGIPNAPKPVPAVAEPPVTTTPPAV
jgi:hypothetical protein